MTAKMIASALILPTLTLAAATSAIAGTAKWWRRTR